MEKTPFGDILRRMGAFYFSISFFRTAHAKSFIIVIIIIIIIMVLIITTTGFASVRIRSKRRLNYFKYRPIFILSEAAGRGINKLTGADSATPGLQGSLQPAGRSTLFSKPYLLNPN